MFRCLNLLFLMLMATLSWSQQISYTDWKKEAAEDIRLWPEYHHAIKTADQLDADKEFIELSVKTHGSRQQASQAMVDIGFRYMYQGNLKVAMYRFNQAWLLNPKNENAYWGFGGVYMTLNDYDEALNQYDKGLKINPQSSNIPTDMATLYVTRFHSNGDHDDFRKGIELFNSSYQIDPKNQNTIFKLSAAYFLTKDCINAVKYY